MCFLLPIFNLHIFLILKVFQVMMLLYNVYFLSGVLYEPGHYLADSGFPIHSSQTYLAEPSWFKLVYYHLVCS